MDPKPSISDADRVQALFEALLGRSATPPESRKWADRLRESGDFYAIFSALTKSPEYLERHRVTSVWRPGHFYSPIVDPETVRDYVEKERKAQPSDIAGIDLNVDEMSRFWRAHQPFIRATPFTEEAVAERRYHWKGGPYPIGDAVAYRAMIHAVRPRRIIEIGSGFSTACALDTLDEIGLRETQVTCIEPYPAVLLKRLRPGDTDRVKIIESIVQEVPKALFSGLERNDILFVDSTHVLKTGSDVHYEFFSILPQLKPGVMIHFHDIRWPFEYPAPFIFERNYSWNEAYALRAMLMYSTRFRVMFYGSFFATMRRKLIEETYRPFLLNPGSSIWLGVQEY